MVEEPEMPKSEILNAVLSIGEDVASIKESMDALTKLVQANHEEIKGETAEIRKVIDNQLAGQTQVDDHAIRIRKLENAR